MKNENDDAPPTIWRTPIGRSDLAFRSLLYTDIKEFFLSPEHLEGLVRQRDRLSKEHAFTFFVSIGIAFIILLNDARLHISISSPIGSIAELPVSTEILLFALSASTSYYATRLIGTTLITRQIGAIFDHIGYTLSSGLAPSEHYVARWSAMNLWSDILLPRAGGYRSSFLHFLFTLGAIVCIILVALSQIGILLIAAYVGLGRALEGSSSIALWSVVVPSVATIHLAIVLPLIALLVPMKYSLAREEASRSSEAEIN